MKKLFSIFFAIIILSLISCSAPKIDKPEIIFCDIGKADCSIIIQGESAVIIDAGEEENSNEILGILKLNRIKKIEHLIFSHFDKDHIGSAKEIIENYEIGDIYLSNIPQQNERYFELMDIIERNNIKAFSEPMKDNNFSAFTFGKSDFTIYYPESEKYENKQDNNASLIISMKYNDSNILFCGDAMEARLSEFIAGNADSFELIKAPYHGNYLENYPEFLKNIDCKNAIITSSNKNPEDEKTLELFKSKDINYYLTRNGNIKITFNESGIKITQ